MKEKSSRIGDSTPEVTALVAAQVEHAQVVKSQPGNRGKRFSELLPLPYGTHIESCNVDKGRATATVLVSFRDSSRYRVTVTGRVNGGAVVDTKVADIKAVPPEGNRNRKKKKQKHSTAKA